MRVYILFGALLSASSLVLSASTEAHLDSNEPEIVVTASFPELNAFGHVVNGEKNLLTLSIENKSNRNVTLISGAGSVHHPETNRLVKNLTAVPYNVPLIEGGRIQVPFMFYSEFKPGDLRLNIWLEHSDDKDKYRVSAYDSVVTIVEPEASIFDFKLITTYLMVAAIFTGLLYFAYNSFIPQSRKPRPKKPTTSTSTAVSSGTATGAGGYSEEWIPEHHLKKKKASKKAADFASGTSGDELSTSEVSGTEGRRRKGKK